MEWAIAIPLVLLLVACPLLMVGMVVGGWIFGRRMMGGHGGHGMMCMGHGDSPGGESGHGSRVMGHGADPTLVEELKAERERLDLLIARAERSGE
ncbi:MAG TPA: hypothetical protein VFT91_00295 [Dehalococcoidia bacterium]|nr:hypothetical protein [Dehalococcoidia bacterium]